MPLKVGCIIKGCLSSLHCEPEFKPFIELHITIELTFIEDQADHCIKGFFNREANMVIML